ncbi:MAG: tyramine oxidase, partial [Dehalococcoidia bacterium]|nr:tyramine oxidase [Dehalococcoidia bacterium]
MTITVQVPEQTDIRAGVNHPLDPLTPDEIVEAVTILKADQGLGSETRFETVTLNEPTKDAILGYKLGAPFDREAFFIVFDNRTSETHEAIVSLTRGEVVSWERIPGVQPRITLDEFSECEAATKSNPEFIEALAKRGIADMDLVMVDAWSAGNFGVPEEEGLRLVFARCWLKAGPNDNGYARPIEGVIPVIDLNRMEVLRVEDHGIVPLPPDDGNYAAEYIEDFRQDLKPLEIVQPEGPSFTVEGSKVSWQKWSMRVGFNPREGLVLHCVCYEDKGKVRPVMYRASLSEMVVPYGDPRPHNFRR